MDAYIGGDVSQLQRLKADVAVFEECLLPCHDGRRRLLDGVGALLDAAHEPLRFLQLRCQAIALAALVAGNDVCVLGVETDPRRCRRVQRRSPHALDLLHNDFGTAKTTRSFPKPRPGLGSSERMRRVAADKSASLAPVAAVIP
jgi:hypothetical protein